LRLRAVITLDYTECEVNARGKSTCCGEIAIFDEACAADELDVRKLNGETLERGMMGSRRFAG
jgi:hypothetical protein